MNGTMINVSIETREKLKKFKLTKFDTYDEIINRMIEKETSFFQQ